MNQHNFEKETERIQSRIRGHQIRGLRHDEQKASIEANVKGKQVSIAQERLKMANMDYQIERQRLHQKSNALAMEVISTQISRVNLGTKRNELSTAEAKHHLQQQQWATELQGMTITLEDTRKELFNRRELLQLKGRL